MNGPDPETVPFDIDSINTEAAARGLLSTGDHDVDVVGGQPLRAVLYLRVSTTSQVNTDYDPEGISLAAQRLACERKAEQLANVEIVGEYVEPGKSGTSVAGRTAFQAMMQRIKYDRDVAVVLVYKLSRMNRNRLDDALVMAELRKYKVTLISATENIDESPVGQLMHGILATINEYRSAEDGADVRYKMGEKAKKGGTIGKAPIGYLNVIERYDGRDVRTVAIDPVRGPLIAQAFDLYASGEYTLEALCDELYDRGLRSRAGRYPEGRMTDGKLAVVLRNPYYCGTIIYKGDEYEGRHEPLVTREIFERVQAVMEMRKGSGQRQRRHHHYLKGALWCGACHRAGKERRIIYTRAKGNGGVYYYFFCRGRQEGDCSEPYIDSIGLSRRWSSSTGRSGSRRRSLRRYERRCTRPCATSRRRARSCRSNSRGGWHDWTRRSRT